MPNPLDRFREPFEGEYPQPGEDFREDLLSGAYLPPRPQDIQQVVDFPTVMDHERRAINLRRATFSDPEAVQIYNAQCTAVSSQSPEQRVQALELLAELEPAACYPIASRFCRELSEGRTDCGYWSRFAESLRDYLPESWFSAQISDRKLAAEGLIAICRNVELEELEPEVLRTLKDTALDSNNTNSLRILALRGLLLTGNDEAYQVFESLDKEGTRIAVRQAAHFAMNAFDILRSTSDREEYFNRLAPVR